MNVAAEGANATTTSAGDPIIPFGAPASAETVNSNALKFLRWARDNGLLAADAYFPGDTVGHPDFGGEPVGQSAISVLRTRQIRFVTVDTAHNRISVFLKKTAPTVREMKVLPKYCDGTALQYYQGSPETVSPTAVAEATSACALHHVGARFLYTCGSSISVGNNREAGTLGCLVKDANGVLYGLTNNHVGAACSYAPFGLPILAPGIIDVTPTNPYPFTLGVHTRQLQLQTGDPTSVDHTQNSDAAIFKIVAIDGISSMQRNHYDTPTSVMDMVPGMSVEKVGRSTARKSGKVIGQIVGPSAVSYSAAQYGFAGAVYLEPLWVIHGVGDLFSEGGDSGSLVTHEDVNGVRHAVGIVVAGCGDTSAAGGKRTLVLPLRPILDKLQVTLVSGHNV